MQSLILYLSFPPSVNNYYSASTRGSIRFLSARGRKFREETIGACHEQGVVSPVAGRLSVTCTLYPPDRRVRDLDNYSKALLDALTHSGVWLDDSQIDQFFVYRGVVRKPGLALIEISSGLPVVEWPPGLLRAP